MAKIKSEFLAHLKELDQSDPVRDSDESLVLRFRAGDDNAGSRLFRKNYKMILKVILDATKNRWYSDDCLQSGAVGLYEAAKRFDTEKGFTFLTYATHWIRKYVLKEVCNELLPAGGIRFSSALKDKLYRFIGLKIMGRTPSEIQSKLGITEAEYTELDQCAHNFSAPLSLNSLLAEDDNSETSTADVDSGERIDEVVSESDSNLRFFRSLNAVMGDLSTEQSDVLRLILGLDQEPIRRSRDIAKIMGRNINDIVSIRRAAMMRLRRGLQDLGVNVHDASEN